MSIILQIVIDIDTPEAHRLSPWFDGEYVPALKRQAGFVQARILENYSAEVRAQMGAAGPAGSHLIEIEFESEPLRAAWEASSDHQDVWPSLTTFAKYVHHVGYVVVGEAEQ